MEAYLRRTGQTSTADAGATARGAIAITRNGLEAGNGIHIRALKQRDGSLAEAAEVKSSLEAVSCQMQDQTKACSPTDQPVRKFKGSLGINMTMKTFFTFRRDDNLVPVQQYKHGVGSPPRGARSGGHDSCQAARTAATYT